MCRLFRAVKVYYDLHIHSALSPCCDNDNTPSDIVQMAKLKGLDVIALSDHNSTANCKAVIKAGQREGLLVLPAIELTTAEDIHILCLFADLSNAESFCEKAKQGMMKIKNRAEIFGEQRILDEVDNIIGYEEHYLSVATTVTSYEVASLVRNFAGVAVPAHVDRPSNGILSILGEIPKDFGFTAVEVSKHCPPIKVEELQKAGFTIVRNSDAHTLSDISERENFMEINTLTAKSVVDYLCKRK